MDSRASWKIAALGLVLLVATESQAAQGQGTQGQGTQGQGTQGQGARGRVDPRSEFKALYHRLLTLENELAAHKIDSRAEIEPVARDRLENALAALDEALIDHPETGPTQQQLEEARGKLETATAAEDASGIYRAKKAITILKRRLDEKQGIVPELRELAVRVGEAQHLAERSQLRHDPEGLELLDRVHGLRQRLAELKAEIESGKKNQS